MRQPYQLLRVSRWVLFGLACLSSASNLIGGFILLLSGGEPVTIMINGPAMPARVMGLISMLVSAPLSFLLFYIPSTVICLLLELRERLPGKA